MSTSSRPRVPDGLRDLMKDLTREILKEKPIDIYDFASNYFQTRLPQKEDYAVKDFEPNTRKYDFSYIQNPQRYQVPVALVYSIIPEGLTNLIKDLIKAILREQPQNLCDFAVEYFRHLKTATQEVETNEISYKAYDNYFTNKERFLFTPYVKCTCGRTFGEGFGSNYQFDNFSTAFHNVHRNDSYATETITTRLPLEDTNNNHVKVGQEHDSTNSQKYTNAVYVIQRYFRRYLKRTKSNNLSTFKNSITQNNCMNEETAAIIIQRTLGKVFGGGSRVTEKQLATQNDEIVSGVPHLQMNHNENDNISEAASYTSASTALLSASESGRETAEMSASENILRKTIVESEEIENENISNFLTRTKVMPMEDIANVDGNQEHEGRTVSMETIVNNRELTDSLENQNTVPDMDKGVSMRTDFTVDESYDHGANKNDNSDHIDQKQDSKTGSLSNFTSNNTKNYTEHQMETSNDKITQEPMQTGIPAESGYIPTEDDNLHNKTNEEVLQQKDKNKAETIQSISNDKLNNEYGLENTENASTLKEFTNNKDDAQEEEYHIEQQKLDSDSPESLGKESSILQLNQEIIESCDEIQRTTLTNIIDNNSKENSNENVIINEASLVKETDSIENKEEFKRQHLENTADVIDGSMEKLYEKPQTATEENKDMDDLKRENIQTSPSKENLNEPETNSVTQELLYESQRDNITSHNEIQEKKDIVKRDVIFTKIIENADENGGKDNVNKSNEHTIKEPAEVLLRSDSEQQKDSLINEKMNNVNNSNDFPLETDTSKEKAEDSNLSQAEHERNENRSVIETDKLVLNKIQSDFPKTNNNSNKHEVEFENLLNDSSRIETKLMKDSKELSDDQMLEKTHDFVDENDETIQKQNDKDIHIKTEEDVSGNNLEIKSNHRTNETNVSSGNVISNETDVSGLTVTESNANQNKINDNNQSPYSPDKYEDETEAKQTTQVHNITETDNATYVTDLQDSSNKITTNESTTEDLIDEKQPNNHEELDNIKECEESCDTESESKNHAEPILNELEQQQPRKETQVNILTKPNKINENSIDKSTKSSNEHEFVKALEIQDTINESNLVEDEDDDDKKSMSKSNNDDITKASTRDESNKYISNETAIREGEELQQDDHKKSDSHEQSYIKDSDKPIDEDITQLRTTSFSETSKDDENNKYISNEAAIMKENDQKESDSHLQIYLPEEELEKLKDHDITQLREASSRETENSNEEKNNKSIYNKAAIMEGEELQQDDQKKSDSHEEILRKEQDKPNNEDTITLKTSFTGTRKDDENNKSISNEAAIVKEGEDNERKITSGKTETSNGDKNNKSIPYESTNDNDITELSPKSRSETETGKEEKSNKCISNEAAIVKEDELKSDNQKESNSHEQKFKKEKELNAPNDEDETKMKTTIKCSESIISEDDKNKYISDEATIVEEKLQQPKDQKESDSHKQIYLPGEELEKLKDDDITHLRKTSNKETETSKEDKNNKSISSEAAIVHAEELQQDGQKKSDSHEEILIKELDKPNDEDTIKLITSFTGTSKDVENNKSLSSEATIVKEDEDNERKITSGKTETSNGDKNNKSISYPKSCSETETSQEDKSNAYISNTATILNENELQSENQKESDFHEQICTKAKELNAPIDEDKTKMIATSSSEAITIKDDKNKSISNKDTTMEEKLEQPNDHKQDDQGKSESHEEILIKELNDEDTIKLKTSFTGTSKDDENNKSISSEARIMKEAYSHKLNNEDDEKEITSAETETSKDDTNNKSISNEAKTDKDITQLRPKSCSETDTSKDDKHNKYISNEAAIMKVEELQQDGQEKSDSHKETLIKELDNDEETIKLKTSFTGTTKDDENNKSISNEAAIVKEDDSHKLNDENNEREMTNAKIETSKDDKNTKSISHEATNDKDVNQQGATSSSETESSKEETNKSITNEATVIEEEELQSDVLQKPYDEDTTKLITITCSEALPISNGAIHKKPEEPLLDVQKASDSHNLESDSQNITKLTNQQMSPIKNEFINQEAQQNVPIVDDLNISKVPLIPNQIEIQETQYNKSIVKRLINPTDPNTKEAQGDQPQFATNAVDIFESGEKIVNNNRSIEKDEFGKDTLVASETSSIIYGPKLDKQKLTSTENDSNDNTAKLTSTENESSDDKAIKNEQITSVFRTDQEENINNKSLKSNNENLLQQKEDLQVHLQFNNEINTYIDHNLNEASDFKGEKIGMQKNEHSVSDLIESGILKNEYQDIKNTKDETDKCINLSKTEIKNEQFHEIYTEETSGTDSCIDGSDLVLNSTEYKQMQLKPDNTRSLPTDTINSSQLDKFNVDNLQIHAIDEKKEAGINHHTNNNCSPIKPVAIANALINEKASLMNCRELDSKSESVTDHKDKLKEDNERESENSVNKKPDLTMTLKDNMGTPNPETNNDMSEGTHEMQSIQENNKIEHNESNLETNEDDKKNSKPDIDETVHRILTERLKELRIQNEQNVLRKQHSETKTDSSKNNDTKQNEQTESDINSNINVLTKNIPHNPHQEAIEKSLINAESESYLLENMGDKNEVSNVSPNEPKIEQDFKLDHSENDNRLRRSLSNNNKLNIENVESLQNAEKSYAESEDKMSQNDNSQLSLEENSAVNTNNNSVTKISMDQAENKDLSKDKTIVNVLESGDENDQETTLHNIGNKSPDTLIGNQNLNIGRIRNYNEGLIESISGQRFAETHLKSFWKEYQMNNGKPLDQYDCGGNEKVSTIETKQDDQSLKDNLEMINHTTEKINENEYVLIHNENVVGSMANQQDDPLESLNTNNISEDIEDSNASYNDINHNKNVERIPRYFHGSIPTAAKHYLLEKRKTVKEPTSFTIPFAKSTKLQNDGKSSKKNSSSPERTFNKDNLSESDQMAKNKEINLDNCADVEPLLDSESPTKLFSELNEFDYDETHDIDLEITYTLDEIIQLKTEHDSQKNSDEESELDLNEYSPIIIRLTDKNESQPISDDSQEDIIDPSEFSPTPESMLHTIVELSEPETPRADSKSMISSPALLQRNDEDYLTNLEKISNSTSTSWTTGSKDGEEYSFVSDEFLEDENYHKEKSPTKPVPNEMQGGIYEYTEGKSLEPDSKEYENLIKQAPSPPNDDPFYEDAIEKAAIQIQTAYREYLRRKNEVSTENNEYSDEIINGKRDLLMAVCTIQRAFRNYQLQKKHMLHNNSDTMDITQLDLDKTNNEYSIKQAHLPPSDDSFCEDEIEKAANKIQTAYSDNNEFSDEIINGKRSLLMAVCTIQKAFRNYQLQKNSMVHNNSDTMVIAQPDLGNTNNEHSNDIVSTENDIVSMNGNVSATNTLESKQFADHSRNNTAAIVIQKAFRQYLDHKLILNNEQDSTDNNVEDDKNKNVGGNDDIKTESLKLIENVPQRKDELENIVRENDTECISNLDEDNLSQNITDSPKIWNTSSVSTSIKKNDNTIMLNVLIGQFIDSERQYSDDVNQPFNKTHKALKATTDLAESFIDQSVSRSLLNTDFQGETNLTKEIVENSDPEELTVKSEQSHISLNNKNYIIQSNPQIINNNPTQSNVIENVTDLVEQQDFNKNPSTESIENLNENDGTEKNNNSKNRSSEIVTIENYTLNRNEVGILRPPETGGIEKSSENKNHENSFRSKEPSQEMAATIIQKAFRSYSQIKNKPHELELGCFDPTAPKEEELYSYHSSSTLNSTNSYRIAEEQAARVIQKAVRKFMHRKSEDKLINDDTSSDQTTKWFVGDEPIIANESLVRSPSEISFDETEAYVELNDNPQYSVDLCSNLDKSDANNPSRTPTAPVSYRSSSSVDLNNVDQTNHSEEIVYVVGTGIKAVQLMHKNQGHPNVPTSDSSETLANEEKSFNEYPEINDHQETLGSNENEEIAKLHNLIGQFITSERQYSDAVNQSNSSRRAPKEVPLKSTDNTELLTDFLVFQKEFSDSMIPYEELEELCIKKTVSKSIITTDSKDEAINGDELSTSSDMDNDTEDSLSMKTVKLHEPEEAIEKMKQRRDSTTKISNLDKLKDYSFDEPLVEPIDNLDTDEDGIVVCKLNREETRESSAQSEEDVILGDDRQTLEFFETNDLDTQFPPKGSLKRVHTIAGDTDAKSLLKNVTIDTSIKYIEPPDFEVDSGSFCLDDATSQNIRRNMMAYSLSEADSDCFDKNLNHLGNSSLESKSQKYDDFNVSTALIDNGDTSTETESTIVSAVTKIQAGARGYLTRKRLGRTSNTSDHKSLAQDESSKASFGNAAISESLEHLVQEAAAKRIQKVYRKHYRQKLAEINQQNETTSPELTTSMESSLAQKRSIMLQRGDAIRNDSTPDEGNSSSNGSDDQKAKIQITVESKPKFVNKQTNDVKSTDGNQSLSQAKTTAAAIRANKIEDNKKRWLAMRQNSMPVQIDSEVLRVIPKHMRKKIKSAEGEKKRNGRRRVLKD